MASTDKQQGGSWYTVRAGDWVSKIADRFGFADWKTVWNDPRNADLRDLRPEPNVLQPGDRVYIPLLGKKELPCRTDQVHKFMRKTSKKKLKLVLRDAYGEPRANEPCALAIDHKPCLDVKATDTDGHIEALIPESAIGGVLMVGEDRAEVYQLLLGHLDPIETVKGYQQRLANLGHYTGDPDGIIGPLTKKAIRSFQSFENQRMGHHVLAVDGIMGPETRKRLQEFHGY